MPIPRKPIKTGLAPCQLFGFSEQLPLSIAHGGKRVQILCPRVYRNLITAYWRYLYFDRENKGILSSLQNTHNAYNRGEGEPMKFREIVKILQENGWQQKSVKGSHYQYIHPSKPGKITIPCHRGDLDKRTVKSIFTAAGLDTSKLI